MARRTRTPELFSGKDLVNLELERDFQNRVIEVATLNRWRVYAIGDSRRATMAGYPDLTMWNIHQRRLIFAELKREKGRVSEAQKMVLGELEQIPGAECYLWRPSQWNEIVATLSKRGKP
jgi:hypothetical protein